MRNKKISYILFLLSFIFIAYGIFCFSKSLVEFNQKTKESDEEVKHFIDTHFSDSSNPDSVEDKIDSNPVIDSNTLGVIRIQSIGLEAPIAYGTEPDTLKKYVGYYPDFDTFGETGLVALAAHSTRFIDPCPYCYFQEVPNLQEGDKIEIYWYDGNVYSYTVYDIQNWMDENSEGMFDRIEGKEILVLQTCTNGQGGIRTYVHAERTK